MMKLTKVKMKDGIQMVKKEDLNYPNLQEMAKELGESFSYDKRCLHSDIRKKNTGVHASTIWNGWSKPRGTDNGLIIYRHVSDKEK